MFDHVPVTSTRPDLMSGFFVSDQLGLLSAQLKKSNSSYLWEKGFSNVTNTDQ